MITLFQITAECSSKINIETRYIFWRKHVKEFGVLFL